MYLHTPRGKAGQAEKPRSPLGLKTELLLKEEIVCMHVCVHVSSEDVLGSRGGPHPDTQQHAGEGGDHKLWTVVCGSLCYIDLNCGTERLQEHVANGLKRAKSHFLGRGDQRS